LGWSIKYGEKLEWFQELEDKGEHIPAMDERVALFTDMAIFYNAWNELSSSRQAGMGLGYIGQLVITDWLNEEHIFEYLERAEYRYWIKRIDGVYLQLKSDEDEKKRDAKPKNTPPKK
jgi:hypothetical protein